MKGLPVGFGAELIRGRARRSRRIRRKIALLDQAALQVIRGGRIPADMLEPELLGAVVRRLELLDLGRRALSASAAPRKTPFEIDRAGTLRTRWTSRIEFVAGAENTVQGRALAHRKRRNRSGAAARGQAARDRKRSRLAAQRVDEMLFHAKLRRLARRADRAAALPAPGRNRDSVKPIADTGDPADASSLHVELRRLRGAIRDLAGRPVNVTVNVPERPRRLTMRRNDDGTLVAEVQDDA